MDNADFTCCARSEDHLLVDGAISTSETYFGIPAAGPDYNARSVHLMPGALEALYGVLGKRLTELGVSRARDPLPVGAVMVSSDNSAAAGWDPDQLDKAGDALSAALIFAASPEGFNFWHTIRDRLTVMAGAARAKQAACVAAAAANDTGEVLVGAWATGVVKARVFGSGSLGSGSTLTVAQALNLSRKLVEAARAAAA